MFYLIIYNILLIVGWVINIKLIKLKFKICIKNLLAK